MPESVFKSIHDKRYHRRYQATLAVYNLHGGIPSDPNVAKRWFEKLLGADNESIAAQMVAQTMLERHLEMPEAVEVVGKTLKVNGFKRDKINGLYFEGRCIKAAIKEAANICWPKRKWGTTSKGTMSYWPEQVFVVEDRIYLGCEEADGVEQRFVHTWRGSGIQNEEYIEEATLRFTVITSADKDVITEDDFAELWTCGEQQGTGASRSLGYGRYVVTQWDRVSASGRRSKALAA